MITDEEFRAWYQRNEISPETEAHIQRICSSQSARKVRKRPGSSWRIEEIRIHLTARGVLRLEREPYLASRLQQQREGEGLLSLRLRPEEYEWLVRILLSLGTDAKVLAPEELQMRVQQEAQEIARYYAEM